MPGCDTEMVNEKGTVIAEICHIRAYSKGGARHDPTFPDHGLNSEENLILFCGGCHTVVDNEESHWTVERLIDLKSRCAKSSKPHYKFNQTQDRSIDTWIENYHQNTAYQIGSGNTQIISPQIVHINHGTPTSVGGHDHQVLARIIHAYGGTLEAFFRNQQVGAGFRLSTINEAYELCRDMQKRHFSCESEELEIFRATFTEALQRMLNDIELLTGSDPELRRATRTQEYVERGMSRDDAQREFDKNMERLDNSADALSEAYDDLVDFSRKSGISVLTCDPLTQALD